MRILFRRLGAGVAVRVAASPRLSDDDKLHHALLGAARRGAGRKYLTENVIGDPNQTFGIEIEFSGGSATLIARELYRLGLCSSPRKEHSHSVRVPGKWIVESDPTVRGEVISPILTDTPQTWEQIRQVCRVIRKYGGRTSCRTGGHIHVGLESSGLTKEGARGKLARTYGWAEDLLYRVAGGSGPLHSHRGRLTAFHYCAPMEPGDFQAAESDSFYGGHTSGLNTGNYHTVEFRYNDGFLNPERIQANIMLACALMQYAASQRDELPAEHNPVGLNKRLPDREHRMLRTFADVVLRDHTQRLKLYSVYSRTQWGSGKAGQREYVRRVARERRQRTAPGQTVAA